MKLTVVISARNEGQEVVRTIDSLFEHSDVDCVLINDWSDRWIPVEPRKGLAVIHNEYPVYGLIESIRRAVKEAKTEGIFFCNARYRFTPGWDKVVLEALEADPRRIYTPTSVALYEDQLDMDKASRLYGANLKLWDGRRWFSYKSTKNKKFKGNIYVGGVAFTKEWFAHIHGFDGLIFRSCMNPFLSIKSHLAGGPVEVLDCEVGNVYRKHTSYPVPGYAGYYNTVFMAYVLMGPAKMDEVMETFKREREYEYTKHMVASTLSKMAEERKYLRSIRILTFNFN